MKRLFLWVTAWVRKSGTDRSAIARSDQARRLADVMDVSTAAKSGTPLSELLEESARKRKGQQ